MIGAEPPLLNGDPADWLMVVLLAGLLGWPLWWPWWPEVLLKKEEHKMEARTQKFTGGKLRVGDFVVIDKNGVEVPGLIIDVNPHSDFRYRVGGYWELNNQLWDAWFPAHQVRQDITA